MKNPLILTNEEMKEYIERLKLSKEPIRINNDGTKIYDLDFSNILIHEGKHYIPAEYRFYSDVGKEKAHYNEDKYYSFPTPYFDDELEKWVVEVDCPDIGGYDVITVLRYFDNKEDIFNDE